VDGVALVDAACGAALGAAGSVALGQGWSATLCPAVPGPT